MAKLTSKTRNALPGKDFVFPKDRSYPINDASHARNALSRVSQFGTDAQKASVRARVHAKYPDIGKADGGGVDELGGYRGANAPSSGRKYPGW